MLSGSRRQKRVVTHLVTFGVAASTGGPLVLPDTGGLPVPDHTPRSGPAGRGADLQNQYQHRVCLGAAAGVFTRDWPLEPASQAASDAGSSGPAARRGDLGRGAGPDSRGIWIFHPRPARCPLQHHLQLHLAPHLENAPFFRLGPFGWANHVGLIATLLIILLLAISNDYSVRKLGTRRWKSLQRWTYYFVGLLAIHSVLYQLVEHRPVPFVVLFSALMVLGLAIQLYGVRLFRRLRP